MIQTKKKESLFFKLPSKLHVYAPQLPAINKERKVRGTLKIHHSSETFFYPGYPSKQKKSKSKRKKPGKRFEEAGGIEYLTRNETTQEERENEKKKRDATQVRYNVKKKRSQM